MTIAIVDYGSGNLRSAAKAFERVVRERRISNNVVVTSEAAIVATASRVILPGVGAFGACSNGLSALPGMIDALECAVRKRRVPFLGICVGMQLMAERGYEHGEHSGLGWIAGEVVEMKPLNQKVPHMGWNGLEVRVPDHPLLTGVSSGDHAYFVHSYWLRCADERDLLATVDYGGLVSAMVVRGNCAGAQFHPEKSQAVGLKVIANFLDWNP